MQNRRHLSRVGSARKGTRMKKQEADTASEEAPSVLSGLAFLALTTRCHNFAARSQQPANCYSLSGEYLGRSKLLLVASCFFLKGKTTLLLLVPLADIAANKHGAEFIAVRPSHARALYLYPHAGRAAIFALWRFGSI